MHCNGHTVRSLRTQSARHENWVDANVAGLVQSRILNELPNRVTYGTYCLHGLKFASRLILERNMSIDILHVLVAVLFIAIWIAAILVLRVPNEHDLSKSANEWDGTF